MITNEIERPLVLIAFDSGATAVIGPHFGIATCNWMISSIRPLPQLLLNQTAMFGEVKNESDTKLFVGSTFKKKRRTQWVYISDQQQARSSVNQQHLFQDGRRDRASPPRPRHSHLDERRSCGP
jgi:hypothetical protein